MHYTQRFMVKPGTKARLDKIDPSFKDKHESHKAARSELEEDRQKLRELQYRLYAEGKRSLLICLQAMDAGGKDGTVNHVLGAMNPQGCSVYGFKRPSREEAAHDFLWRIHTACPAKGHVSIFNRSHYEDVLVVRVHELAPEKLWSKHYEHINAFEKLLSDSGTRVLKFYLHISKEEQLARFKQRIDDPARHWKISDSDYTERAYWNDYVRAFQAALTKCSTHHAPWFVIPANHKWFRNLAVARIVIETLEGMNLEFPDPTVDIKTVERKYHEAEER